MGSDRTGGGRSSGPITLGMWATLSRARRTAKVRMRSSACFSATAVPCRAVPSRAVPSRAEPSRAESCRLHSQPVVQPRPAVRLAHPATSSPGLGSPIPHLRRDWACWDVHHEGWPFVHGVLAERQAAHIREAGERHGSSHGHRPRPNGLARHWNSKPLAGQAAGSQCTGALSQLERGPAAFSGSRRPVSRGPFGPSIQGGMAVALAVQRAT